jgi:hypothetical protein
MDTITTPPNDLDHATISETAKVISETAKVILLWDS